mgnify:CR=1 FL=1
MYVTEDQAVRISEDGLIHDKERLKELQALPLDRKIGISTARIIEWYNHYNGNVFVSFSGGKDSTVLLHLVRNIFPDVPAVFSNTGLEFPELQKFVKTFDNVITLHPKMNFKEVLSKYGYPIIGKEVAEAIYYARRITHPNHQEGSKTYWHNWRRVCLVKPEQLGEKTMFNKSKWLPIARDLPVMISHYCCNVMKKSILLKFQKETGLNPIVGTMAEESRIRKQNWIRYGCNAYDSKKPTSQPLSFWTEQDILTYIKLFELDIASPYGEINIVDKKGNIVIPEGAFMPDGCKYQCSGCQRTGCVYCGFGAHLEKGETRFQLLAKTHPRQYEYCIGGGQWADNPAYDPTASMEPDEMGWINWNPKKIWVPSKDGLGLGEVFRMCNEIMGYEMYKWE